MRWRIGSFLFCSAVCAGSILLSTAVCPAQLITPPGGWTYIYTGDAANAGAGLEDEASFDALDGTWSHDNGSDQWDGSAIGSGNPGGASSIAGYLRLQDTGDPRDYGMSDPGSNRKLYFGHDLTAKGAPGNAIDLGAIISFRARVATTPPLDEQHVDGGGGIVPWPAGGDGYFVHDGGKGNFGIHQDDGGTISFSLVPEVEATPNGIPGGLIMNNLNGNAITGNVDSGEAGALNLLAIDVTEWHDYYIEIQPGGAGTHQVSIRVDGAPTPQVFDVTAGSGSDFGLSYIAMGVGSTGQSGAIDIDYYAVQVVPEPSALALLLLSLAGLAMCRSRRR